MRTSWSIATTSAVPLGTARDTNGRARSTCSGCQVSDGSIPTEVSGAAAAGPGAGAVRSWASVEPAQTPNRSSNWIPRRTNMVILLAATNAYSRPEVVPGYREGSRRFILVPFGPSRRHIIRFVQGGGSGAAQDADPIGDCFQQQNEHHGSQQGRDRCVQPAIEYQTVRIGDSRGGNRSGRNLRRECAGLREKSKR